MAEDRIILPHRLTLNDRKALTLTGATEIISFDDNTVVLHTNLGRLTVHGQQLQLKTLSVESGQAAVEGTITALVYEEPRPAGGLLRRLFT